MPTDKVNDCVVTEAMPGQHPPIAPSIPITLVILGWLVLFVPLQGTLPVAKLLFADGLVPLTVSTADALSDTHFAPVVLVFVEPAAALIPPLVPLLPMHTLLVPRCAG